MTYIPRLLSKTKLLRGYRCHKYIHLTIHHPELEAPITPETQALFDQGNQVGEKARSYFPGGLLIDNKPWDFSGALAKTREAISSGTQIIYEAAFEYMGCYARADIIKFSPETQRWSIYEVKSSTKLKPEHIEDAGLQTWIIAKSGLPIERVVLMHLNPNCRYPDLSNLFFEHDITEDMRTNYLSVQPKIYEIINTIRQEEAPSIDIGPYCLAPTECGFKQYCWQAKQIPALSILNLPQIKEKKWELYHNGIIQIDDPRLTNLNELQERIVETYKTGKRYINTAEIKMGLAEWQFPLVFLDFETTNPAIPRFEGCSPYQHVPFQFSVHIWEKPESDLKHHEFLWTTPDDPRPSLIPALLKACGTQGSIVAYYSLFEAARIQDLAEYSPEHTEALNALNTRLVDPLPLIRSSIYDNAFEGSFSLKKVASALLGQTHSYENMLVANGGAAQRAFDSIISNNISESEKEILIKALLEYCKKDTLEVVELVKWLYQQTNEI